MVTVVVPLSKPTDSALLRYGIGTTALPTVVKHTSGSVALAFPPNLCE